MSQIYQDLKVTSLIDYCMYLSSRHKVNLVPVTSQLTKTEPLVLRLKVNQVFQTTIALVNDEIFQTIS